MLSASTVSQALRRAAQVAVKLRQNGRFWKVRVAVKVARMESVENWHQ